MELNDDAGRDTDSDENTPDSAPAEKKKPREHAALRVIDEHGADGGENESAETDTLDDLTSADAGVRDIVLLCGQAGIDLGPVRSRLSNLSRMVAVPGNFFNVALDYLNYLKYAVDLKTEVGTNVTALHYADIVESANRFLATIPEDKLPSKGAEIEGIRSKVKNLLKK